MFLERSAGTWMSLIYGLSYPKGYSIAGNIFVIFSDSILRVILSLKNILYHKNISMIMQSVGSTGYPSLFYSPIAHSITLVHPE